MATSSILTQFEQAKYNFGKQNIFFLWNVFLREFLTEQKPLLCCICNLKVSFQFSCFCFEQPVFRFVLFLFIYFYFLFNQSRSIYLFFFFFFSLFFFHKNVNFILSRNKSKIPMLHNCQCCRPRPGSSKRLFNASRWRSFFLLFSAWKDLPVFSLVGFKEVFLIFSEVLIVFIVACHNNIETLSSLCQKWCLFSIKLGCGIVARNHWVGVVHNIFI